MSASCRHCGLPAPTGQDFCCPGCKAAFELLQGLGMEAYYQRRRLDPTVRPMRPEDRPLEDLSALATPGDRDTEDRDTHALYLMVEGLQCAACVWLIESVLHKQPDVITARLNMTTRRLVVRWSGPVGNITTILAPVHALGYRLAPYDPRKLDSATSRAEKELLRCMAVAGFATANIMLFSVSIWSGMDMGTANRSLFHWLSALIAFPAIAYAARPFARSAFSALRHGRTTMDVPITLAILLSTLTSLWETARGGPDAYFDASAMLLFFLLVGRYLDSRARGQARSVAEYLLSLGARAITVERRDGTRISLPPHRVHRDDTVLVAAGERIGVDATIIAGRSDIDMSPLSGETLPRTVAPGDEVFAGTLNLSGPLRLNVRAVGEETLLAEIARLMETAEQGRAKAIILADTVARFYAPVVHLTALLTFLGWTLLTPTPWQDALLIAIAVLIITCPCALALAVPSVQVIASGHLLRRGVLLKSATALERLSQIDTVVFDKTGTLTLGTLRPMRENPAWTDKDLQQAAAMAACSTHPLARALAASFVGPTLPDAIEHPGQGLEWRQWKLGSAIFCGLPDEGTDNGPEIWLTGPNHSPVRFTFLDTPRPDTRDTIAALRTLGLEVELLSGDRSAAVRAFAGSVGLTSWSARCSPADKVSRLHALAAAGKTVLMVGDGLNDAPALASAAVSMSPSSAADLSQTAADIVFQGERLAPVVETLAIARRADRLVRQNFALSLCYNIIAIPLAITGMVTPLIAALAMSGSSLLVVLNALRLSQRAESR